MENITFKIDGIDGDFVCDADELKSYRTLKQFACGDTDAAGVFEALERVFMGRDVEYMERVGGGVENIKVLCDAAVEAAKAKNASASSDASKSTATK